VEKLRKYSLLFLLFIFATAQLLAQECNVLSKANDITPDKYCAPVKVDWKISYRGVMNVTNHTDISFDVDWGDGTIENIPFGNAPGTVRHLGGNDYEATINHIFIQGLNGTCNYRPRVWLRIGTHQCASTVQEQNVTVWDVDNANGGHLNVEEQIVYVCVGEDTLVNFFDRSEWNCVPPAEVDNVNNQSRWLQWQYGVGGTTLNNVFVDGVKYSGAIMSDPVNKLNGPVVAPQMPASRSKAVYVSATTVADIGKEFVVQLNNWNFCNQYPGNDPVIETARIIIVDIPRPTIKFNTASDTSVCMGRTVQLTGTPAGGIWSSPSGGFTNPNNGRFSTNAAKVGVHEIIYTYIGNGDCVGEARTTIRVNPNPSISSGITGQIYLCPGTSFVFKNTVNGGTSPFTYKWELDTSPLSATNILNPVFVTNTPDTYNVRLRVTDKNNCSATRTSNFIVGEVNITFDIGEMYLCQGDVTKLNFKVSGGSGNYIYSWTGDVKYLSGADNNPSFTASDTGVFKLYSKVMDDFGCDVLDSIIVHVGAVPVPEITGGDRTVCGFNTVIEAKPAATGATSKWQVMSAPGNIKVEPIDNDKATLIVNKEGIYTLRRIEKAGNCEAWDEVNIRFVKNPEPFAGNDASVCDTEYRLNAKPSVGNGSWVFIDGPANLSFQNQFSDKTLITSSQPGEYSLAWREDNQGCIQSDTVKITFNALPKADFTMSHNGDCSPLEVDFSSTSVNGDTYLWHFQGAAYSVLENPAYTFDLPDDKDTTFRISLEVTTAAGCVDTISKTLLVNPKPLAKINTTYKPSCSPVNPIFENASMGGVSYTWDFGDSTSLILNDKSNVSHGYINKQSNNEVKSFLVNLVAVNKYGCTDTAATYLMVYPEADYKFRFEGNPVCESTNVLLSADGGAKQYRWDLGNGKTIVGANPQVYAEYFNLGLNDTTFRIHLQSTSFFGCQGTFTDSLNVHPIVEAGVIRSEKIKSGSLELTLADDSRNGDKFFIRWGDGRIDTIDSKSSFPVSHTYTNNDFFPVLYNVSYIVESKNGCRDSLPLQVKVFPGFVVDFDMPLAACSPVFVQFENRSTPAGLFEWDFGDGSPRNTKLFPFHTFENKKSNGEPDTFYVRLTGKSMWGFTDTIVKPIVVYPSPKAVWNITATNKPDDEVNIENKSELASVYYWNLDDGDLDTTYALGIMTKSFGNINPEQIIKNISLKAENAYGCVDSIASNVTVNPLVIADFDVDTVSCSPMSVVAQSTSVGAVFYEWSIDGAPFIRGDVRYPVDVENNTQAPELHQITLRVRSVYGDESVKTKTVRVNPVPEARMVLKNQGTSAMLVDIENQSVGGNVFDWNLDYSQFSQTTDNGNVQKLITNPTGLPQPHVISLQAYNNFGCVDSTSEMVIVYPEVKAGFNMPSEGCPPLQVKFEDTSVGALFYEWEIVGENTFYGRNLVYEFKNNTQSDRYYRVRLRVESVYGFSDTLSKVIRIKPAVKAVFDATTGGLSPFKSQISNQSVNALESWFNFNDGSPLEVVSGLADVEHVFKAVNRPETYDVKLTVVSPQGCFDSTFNSVMVYPPLSVSFSCDTVGCSPFDVTFTNTSLGADLFIWNFGNGTGDWMSREAFHRFENFSNVPKVFTVTLMGQSKYGFSETITKNITVYPRPQSFFEITPEGDSPMEAIAKDLSSGAVNYSWNMGEGTVLHNPGASFSHWYTNLTGAPISRSVVQKVVNQYGCVDSSSQTVHVFPTVTADFDCVLSGCSPLTVVFRNLSEGAIRYKWNFGDGSTIVESSRPVHIYHNTTADSVLEFVVEMIAYSQFGYSDTTYKTITVYPVPVSSFVVDKPLGCAPLLVSFDNLSLGSTQNSWQFDAESVADDAKSFTRLFNNESFLPKYVEVKHEAKNSYGCMSTSGTIIEVFPVVKAAILADTASCSPLTAVFINKSVNANDFQWSFNGVVDYRQNPMYQYENKTTAVDVHKARLTVSSVYGCSDTAYHQLKVYPQPNLDFTVTPRQGYSPLNISVLNQSGNASRYVWNFGVGDSVVKHTNESVAHLYINETLAPIVQKVTLEADNKYGCKAELSRSVDVYPSVIARFQPPKNGCSPLTVDFKNESFGAIHFQWSFGDGRPVSVASNPTHTFVNNSNDSVKTFVVELIAFSQFGFADTFRHEIQVFPTPVTDFALNAVSSCSPFNMVVNNKSKGVGMMTWDFGFAEPFTNNDTVLKHTYENMKSMPDYYNIIGIKTNEYGCSHRLQKAIEVLPGVVASFNGDTIGCSPFTTVLKNNSKNATEYKWDFGDGTSTMDNNPIKRYTNKNSDDFVSYLGLIARNNYGCADTFRRKVIVYPEPDFSFEVYPAEVTMPNAEIKINATLKNEGPWRFVWDFGDGTTSDSISPGVHTYGKWGKYNLKVNITDTRCSDVQYKGVQVNPAVPIAEFAAPTLGCTPVTLEFENRSAGMVASLWDFGDGTLSTADNPVHTYYRPGAFDVKLTVFNDVGNADTFVQRVNIYEGVKADFMMSPHVVNSFAQEVKFANFSQNGYNYIWNFGDGDMSHEFEPAKRYNKEGKYDIMLISISEQGCRDTMIQASAVEVSDVYNVRFPNVFIPLKTGSPGSSFSTGETHIFYPLIDVTNLKEYRLMVFDRWGLMVFETKNPAEGWDGYYRNELCPQGVYVWKVRAVFDDGNEVVKVGDVTLLR
jgi:PKD repeat protein